jgi:predicted nucleic acid-binding protein
VRCGLDANVPIAALLSRRGAPARLVRLWLDSAFEVVVSPRMMEELERVIGCPRIRSRVAETEARAFLRLIGAGQP